MILCSGQTRASRRLNLCGVWAVSAARSRSASGAFDPLYSHAILLVETLALAVFRSGRTAW